MGVGGDESMGYDGMNEPTELHSEYHRGTSSTTPLPTNEKDAGFG